MIVLPWINAIVAAFLIGSYAGSLDLGFGVFAALATLITGVGQD